MESEGKLMVELSTIQNKRLGIEFTLLKELKADEEKHKIFSKELAIQLTEAIRQNWEDEEEYNKRYFDVTKSQMYT